MLRQERLQKKVDSATTTAVIGGLGNSGSIWFVLYGVYTVTSDPGVQSHVEFINEQFGINIDLESIKQTIELWKEHLIGLFASIQGFLIYYRQLRVKMREMDTESIYRALDEDLGKMFT